MQITDIWHDTTTNNNINDDDDSGGSDSDTILENMGTK